MERFEMETFYFTMTPTQVDAHIESANPYLFKNARGFGCVLVHAKDWNSARVKMCSSFGLKWSMQYSRLSDIHELDRKILASLP